MPLIVAPTEIAESRRLQRTHHRHVTEFQRRWEVTVQGNDAFLGQCVADGLQLRFDITQGLSRIHILDDRPETIDRSEFRRKLKHHLKPSGEVRAGGLLEFLLNECCPAVPDEGLDASRELAFGIVLDQLDGEMTAVDCTQLADLGPHPLRLRYMNRDRLGDFGQERAERETALGVGGFRRECSYRFAVIQIQIRRQPLPKCRELSARTDVPFPHRWIPAGAQALGPILLREGDVQVDPAGCSGHVGIA